MTSSLRIVLKPSVCEITRFNSWLDSAFTAAKLDNVIAADLKLCLNEVIANLISYGFAGTCDPEIEIEIALQKGVATATVFDNGLYFDLRKWTPLERPKDLLTAGIGGFGITLIRERASRIDYQRIDGRNRLTITCSGHPPETESQCM